MIVTVSVCLLASYSVAKSTKSETFADFIAAQFLLLREAYISTMRNCNIVTENCLDDCCRVQSLKRYRWQMWTSLVGRTGCAGLKSVSWSLTSADAGWSGEALTELIASRRFTKLGVVYACCHPALFLLASSNCRLLPYVFSTRLPTIR